MVAAGCGAAVLVFAWIGAIAAMLLLAGLLGEWYAYIQNRHDGD